MKLPLWGKKIKQHTFSKKELCEISEGSNMGIPIYMRFFIVTSNLKNSMYLRSFLCEEA